MGSLFVAIAVFAVWMITAGSPAPSEWVAAGIVAVIGGFVSHHVKKAIPVDFKAPWRWLKGVPLALIRIPGDTFRIVAEILRLLVTGKQPRASLQVVGLPELPKGASPEAWDAYLTGVMSTSPNAMIIGVGPGRNSLLVHQFVHRDAEKVRKDAERLK